MLYKSLKILLFFWLAAVIYGAFFYAPLAEGLGEYTRVLYFHVPVAWITVVAFAMGALFSGLYLKTRNLKYDLWSEAANHLGLIFGILATVTGSIWAKMTWGSFWNWDPRETSIFILLLIYAAYFALRSAVEQPERRAALSSVYDLLAFVTVPFFIFIVPRIYESLHPDPIINDQGKMHMNGQMLLVFLNSLFAYTAVFVWMLVNRIKLIGIELKIKKLEK